MSQVRDKVRELAGLLGMIARDDEPRGGEPRAGDLDRAAALIGQIAEEAQSAARRAAIFGHRGPDGRTVGEALAEIDQAERDAQAARVARAATEAAYLAGAQRGLAIAEQVAALNAMEPARRAALLSIADESEAETVARVKAEIERRRAQDQGGAGAGQ